MAPKMQNPNVELAEDVERFFLSNWGRGNQEEEEEKYRVLQKPEVFKFLSSDSNPVNEVRVRVLIFNPWFYFCR